MKKILIISILGLTLIGCGEKDNKITKDYLLGDWKCTIQSQKGNEELSEPYEMDVSYTIKDDYLYSKEDTHSRIVNLKEIDRRSADEGETIVYSLDDYVVSNTIRLKYIDNDTYIKFYQITYEGKTDYAEFDYYTSKRNTTCNRIK